MQRLFLILMLCLAGCAAQPPAPPRTVNLIVFPGGFNWPIYVAQEKGLFVKHGIDVVVTPTPNSVFQLTNLIGGKFDIAMTAIDNLIAYREGQGEAPVPGPDLFAFDLAARVDRIGLTFEIALADSFVRRTAGG